MYLTEAARPLTGPEKVGALLIALGPEYSAAILSRLSQEEVEKIAGYLAAMQGIGGEVRESVLAEFQAAYESQEEVSLGGLSYAEAVVTRALGQEQAAQVVERLRSGRRAQAAVSLQFLATASGEQLAGLLAEQHPQLITVVLAHVSQDRAAVILGRLPQELRLEVARRVAESHPAPAELVAEIDAGLEQMATGARHQKESTGPKALADLLSLVDRQTERTVLESLTPDLADSVRQCMFVFEDLPKLHARDLQTILQTIGSQDLALALKGAPESLAELVFRNISERTVEAVKEEMELLTRAKPRDLESAQQRIAVQVRDLIAAGQVTLLEEGDA